MTDQPRQPGLAAALAAVQADLPPVTKAKTADVKSKEGKHLYSYKYADLADVSAAIMPLMGRHGLSLTCQPTLRDDGKFGLAYQLMHESGELIDGWYPIDDRLSPQQIGGHITYARRYILCALTGVAAEEDTDGQHLDAGTQSRQPRERPPTRAAGNLPRNQDGSISRGKVTDAELAAAGAMTDAQQRQHNKLEREVLGVDSQGKVKNPVAEHLPTTPPDDPWLDAPAPLRTPQAAPSKAGVIHAQFKRLGATTDEGAYTDEQRYGAMTTITGRRITSTNDLTAAEGIEVARLLSACRDHEVLAERLAVKAVENTAP